MKTIQLFADFFSKKRRTAQQNEKEFFQKLGNTAKIGLVTPTNPAVFVNIVNGYMSQIDGFIPFTIKDVQIMDVFTEKFEFIKTVFSVSRPYGYFYVEITGNEVKFRGDDKFIFAPAQSFRFYLKQVGLKMIFARCVLRKGKIVVNELFEELQDADGGYHSDAVELENPSKKRGARRLLPAPLKEIQKIF